MLCWVEMSLSTTATATPTAPFNPMSFQTECVDSPCETFLYHHSLYPLSPDSTHKATHPCS